MTFFHFTYLQSKTSEMEEIIKSGIKKNDFTKKFILDAIKDNNIDALQSAHEYENLADILIPMNIEKQGILSHTISPLLVAAYEGKISSFQYLLDNGLDITVCDVSNSAGVAHYACAGGHLEMIEYLDSLGVDLQAPDSSNRKPITYACIYGQLEILQWFYVKGVILINQNDIFGQTLLHAAAFSGNTKILEFLLETESNFDINAISMLQFTPLSCAIHSNSIEAVQFFLNRNCSEEPPNSHNSIFTFACEFGSQNIADLFLQRGYEVNQLEKFTGWIPLNYALRGKKEATALMLIEKGSIIDNTDVYCMTPLHWASKFGLLNVVKALVEKGCPVDIIDRSGQTPLFLAAGYGNYETVEYLIQKGAWINCKNKMGFTIPMFATFNNLKIVKLLYEHNADFISKDKVGNTVAHYAVIRKHPEILQFLIEKGIDVTQKNDHGDTPLDEAIKTNYQECIAILKSLQINISIEQSIFSCRI